MKKPARAHAEVARSSCFASGAFLHRGAHVAVEGSDDRIDLRIDLFAFGDVLGRLSHVRLGPVLDPM
jgi:hypothetical protein